MTTTDNNSQIDPDQGLPLRRELIVIAKPEVQLRTSGPSVVSRAGADTTALNDLLTSENATLELLFGPIKSAFRTRSGIGSNRWRV